jgi:uncharacterized membrane protein YkoI
MKINPAIVVASLLLTSASTAPALAASAEVTALKGSELVSHAKVTLAQAQAAALKARPGVITDQELEKEKGGSGLRYSFDVKSKGKVYEVGVDAVTGAVLENAAEGKNPD